MKEKSFIRFLIKNWWVQIFFIGSLLYAKSKNPEDKFLKYPYVLLFIGGLYFLLWMYFLRGGEFNFQKKLESNESIQGKNNKSHFRLLVIVGVSCIVVGILLLSGAVGYAEMTRMVGLAFIAGGIVQLITAFAKKFIKI